MKILFICAGNVARSQMAEAIFNNISDGKNVAVSAGTKVVRTGSNRQGQKLKDKDINIVLAMQDIGIDVSNCIRKQLTLEMLNEADQVIVINPSENIPEFVKHSNKTTFWEVPDPFNQDIEFTKAVRDKIKVLVATLIAGLN